MKPTPFLVIPLTILSMLPCQVFAQTRTYWADAYDLKSKQLLYREKHTETYKQSKPSLFHVQYYRPDGNQFAYKTVRFNNTDYDPDIYLSDQRMQYTEFTRHINSNRYSVGRQIVGKQKIQSKKLQVPDTQVIDNGFDIYIQNHFTELLNRETLHINYIAPAKLDYFRFRFKPINASNNTLTIKIESDVALFRFFTDPITVEYDIPTRKLKTYSGVTNIPKEKNKNYHALLVVR